MSCVRPDVVSSAPLLGPSCDVLMSSDTSLTFFWGGFIYYLLISSIDQWILTTGFVGYGFPPL